VPVIVHLLNRRKFRIVEWAAMDFLREALTRSRRMMELRDLLLLLARVACLLVFGAALARPYWSRSSQAAVDPNQPVHAVVLVDNSLSMSYQKQPDGILLDDAKAKAKEFMEGLPSGSVVSVVPTCGAESGMNFEAYARREDALDALAAIHPVDCAARADQTIGRALKACRLPTGMAGHRILLVTDQQVDNWRADAEKENLKQLPCSMQVEKVTADKVENMWVQDVQLRDGIASAQSPAVFVAAIGYEGSEPRKDVPVILKVDGKQVASQKVDLQPGQLREIVFPEYEFPKPANADASVLNSPRFATQPRYATVEVLIGGDRAAFDRLPGDNRRSIVAPVADSLPVVFVDALGPHEDAKNKVVGDTFFLRRWLAPQSELPGQDRPLVQVRHLSLDGLNRKALADARLVVIAGVQPPSPEQVSLLKQYVEQGGNLLLAAGGSFDPAAWTKAAWLNGLGILPSPLAPAARGFVRDDRRWASSKTPPWSLKLESLSSNYFWPEGVSDDYLREALGPPVFFHKIVVAQTDKAVAEGAAAAATDYFANQRAKLAEIDRQLASLETSAGAGSSQKIANLRQQREKLHPSWLTWKSSGTRVDAEQLPINELAQRARPEVLASYDNDLPMLVERRWGRGQVLFLTTSLSRDWTTLHELPQSAWLMDRIARCLLAETLTAWNVSTEKGFVLPIAAADRGCKFTLLEPDGKSRPLSVDALGGELYGIGLNDLAERGIYHVKAMRGDTAGGDSQSDSVPGGSVPGGSAGALLWDIPLAANGPAEESRLTPVRQGQTEGNSFTDASAIAYAQSPIQIAGLDIWKLLIALMLVLLLAEFLLAARSTSPAEVVR
jgi:hypothetical protein